MRAWYSLAPPSVMFYIIIVIAREVVSVEARDIGEIVRLAIELTFAGSFVACFRVLRKLARLYKVSVV